MSGNSLFKYLFTPIKIGPITVRNRLVITAHATGFVEPNQLMGHPGHYGERYAYYLAERAKGGIGLITFGQGMVHPSSAYEHPGILGTAWDREAIPGMKMAVEMVHNYGAKIFIQLAHSGAHNSGFISKLPAWAPSEVPGLGSTVGREMPKAMEKEDIEELVEYYGRCAENAAEAGFDGIEFHGGTSYLIHQFHSPIWNRRTDEYGGSLENRMRFTLRIIDKTRSIIGNTMALGIRLTVDDFVPSGLTLEEAKEIAKRLEATGKVDYLNNNCGYHALFLAMPTCYEPHKIMVPYSAALKEVVNIPVVAVARIVDPREAEQVLADGHADLIGMTRAHIADPEIANKAREGRLDDIRLCTGCCQLCIGNIMKEAPIDCANDPSVGREKTWGIGTLKPASKNKRVMVVGGGVAGMEFAWVAAARGHRVTLFEKKSELGGQINLAAKLPSRQELGEFVRWRKVMLEKHGVKVVLGKEVTAGEVLRDNPDVVVVATGSNPTRDGFQGLTMQPIAGWDQPHVTIVDDILEGKAQVGKKVIILDDEAHIKGPGIADLLTSRGSDVEIVGRHFMLGNDLDHITRTRVHLLMAERGFRFSPMTFIKSIEKNHVTLYNTVTKATRVLDGVDTVILITGRKADTDLYYSLKGKVKELHRIGDCLSARLAYSAIYDGHKLGWEI